jgi:hypothetical protein
MATEKQYRVLARSVRPENGDVNVKVRGGTLPKLPPHCVAGEPLEGAQNVYVPAWNPLLKSVDLSTWSVTG